MTDFTRMPTDDEVETAKQHLRTVRDRGTRWLLDLIGHDGRPKYSDIRNGYYRLPWTLSSVGEREAAAKVMTWIEHNTLDGSGDLADGKPREGWVDNRATYPLALLAAGAWSLERFDTALAIMKTLRESFQDSESGGIFWERPEARQTGIQILFPTAQVGYSALITGQRDIADGVFTWFANLIKAQPELPHVLYTAWDAAGLRTTMPDDPGAVFLQRTDFREPHQAFYNPGISAAFLSKYYSVTGVEAARDLAGQLLALTEHGTEAQFHWQESMQVCKWGYGLAAALDNDCSVRNLAGLVHMARWYYDSQRPDGSWVPSPFLVREPNGTHATEKTAEHVLWVTMMLSALSGRRDLGV